MTDSIHVRYTKWDGTLHWHFDAVLVDRDHHGTWLLVAPGSEYRRGDEAPRRDEHGFVVLVPDDGWWTAYFNAVPRSMHGHLVYVDMNTPARWDRGTAHLVDLDLDVTLAPDGSVSLLDEDEFEAHQIRYEYPAGLITRTRTAATEVFDAMSGHEEPFGRAGFKRVAAELGWAHGLVVVGHGAASGRNSDDRFPHGTLALQFPHFRAVGIPLAGIVPATINVALPFPMRSIDPRARVECLEWLAGYPRETFEFFDARIAHGGVVHDALIYRPDPATKHEFAQPDGVVEMLAPRIDGIEPESRVSVWIDPRQAAFVT